MFNMGRADAQACISKGEGACAQEFVSFYQTEVKSKFNKDISTKEKAKDFDYKEELSVIEEKLKAQMKEEFTQ